MHTERGRSTLRSAKLPAREAILECIKSNKRVLEREQ